MTFKRPRARILERTITAGNGPYALGGAVDGSYNTFASFLAIGDTTYASVVEPGVAFWTGIITHSDTDEITLTTVEETKGSFGAGTKEIMCGPLASTAVFREDISGAIVTGGTSTAYTVASYRVYDTLARLDGNIIAFTPHTTNGQTVTLNVDGLGVKPLRAAPGVELQSNSLIQGTPYLALYKNSDGVFYLHGMGGNTYGVPLAAGMDYWAATTPSSAFAFPIGQAISRTTYAKLFALIGTTYGAGDGSATFNLPDKTGRVSVMQEGTPTRLTSTYFGGNSTALGAIGGGESHILALGELPSIISSGSNLISVSSSVSDIVRSTFGATSLAGTSGGSLGAFASASGNQISTITSSANNSISVTSTNTLGNPHRTVQPTIVCNYIVRVL